MNPRLTNPGSHVLAFVISLGVWSLVIVLLHLPVLLAVGIGAASYLIALFFLVPEPAPPARRRAPAGAGADAAAEADVPRETGWTQRHLALLVFLGTLVGSLLGALGSLSEIANGLLIPVWESVFPSPIIRVVGSDTILGHRLGMAQAWRADFQEAHSWAEEIPIIGSIERVYDVRIQPTGSVAGVREAQRSAGHVHLLAASEAIQDHDVQQFAANGLTFQCAGEIGHDVVVFVTAKHHEIPVLSKAELREILTGTVRDWSEVWPERDIRRRLPITIFARKGSGTTEVVLSAFTNFHDFPAHFVACSSNADCLNQTLATPGSFYWVSLSWLYQQPFDYLQLLLIKSSEAMPVTNPLHENFNPNWYPTELVRPLYLYVLKGPKTDATALAVAQEFFTYIRGVRGQKTLEEHHFETYFNPPATMPLKLPPGFGRQPDGSRLVCR